MALRPRSKQPGVRRWPRQHPTGSHQRDAERQECEVPAELAAEIVAHVMDAQYLVIHYALDHVERTPAEQQQSRITVRSSERRAMRASFSLSS